MKKATGRCGSTSSIQSLKYNQKLYFKNKDTEYNNNTDDTRNYGTDIISCNCVNSIEVKSSSCARYNWRFTGNRK